MAVQAQWDLARSFDSTLSVAQGFIRAATSDNVQALALLACERFGATLAICPQTCQKVELQIIKLQTPSTRIITFLNGVVGYSRDDCASQLACSLAGVQFIALAAALVPSLSPYNASEALGAMLKTTASDKTFLPPTRHLRDLLSSLEHRCVQLRFSDLALGWVHTLSGLGQVPLYQFQGRKLPDSEGLEKLVDAFRQLSRVGEATNLILKAAECAPWVAAFIQWCIGLPPSIHSRDGTLLLDQPTSKVALFFGPPKSYEFLGLEIEIYKGLDGPAELIFTTTTKSLNIWSGMVSVESYGLWYLKKYSRESGITFSVFTQALQYSLKQVVKLLRLRGFSREIPGLEDHIRYLTNEDLDDIIAYPFPDDSIISNILSRMLNYGKQPGSSELLSLPNDTLIADLPLVKSFLQDCRQKCKCKVCNPSGTSRLQSTSCDVVRFFMDVSDFSADVLALSLFDLPETLLVELDRRNAPSRVKSHLQQVILAIIKDGKPTSSQLHHFLHSALIRIGHYTEESDMENWIASSYKGQVAYPKIFETQNLGEKGYLALSWAPGLLRYDGEVYPRACAVGNNSSSSGWIGSKKPVTVPYNLAPGMNMRWQVSRSDEKLHVRLCVPHSETYGSAGYFSPSAVLQHLPLTLVTQGCLHDGDTALDPPDAECRYIGPLEIGIRSPVEAAAAIDVVAADGNDGLRMIALSEARPGNNRLALVRNSACLACCLATCRRAKHNLLIC